MCVCGVDASERQIQAVWRSWNDGGCQPSTQTCVATATDYQRAAPTVSKRRGTGGPRQMMVAALLLWTHPALRCKHVSKEIITGRWYTRRKYGDRERAGWSVGQWGEWEKGSQCEGLQKLWRDAVSTLIASPQDTNLRGAGTARH